MPLMPNEAPRQYLTSAEVAARIGKSQRTVARWADEGRLTVSGTTANGTRLFRVEDVDTVAAEELAKLEAAAAALKATA